MTDNSHALKRSRRQDSQNKRRQAAAALQAMIDTGEPVSFPAVARRAGVSVSMLYADTELAGRLTQARSLQRDAGQQRAWRLPTRSLISEQSLRVDLANAKDQVRRLNQELAVLRDRLSHQLGAQADTATGRASASLLDELEQQTFELHADNLRLRERIEELEGTLRESNETLEAARAMNRELITEINRPSHPERRADGLPPPRQAPSPKKPPPSRRSQPGV